MTGHDMQMDEQPFGRYNVRATRPVGQVYIFGLVHWVHLHGGENENVDAIFKGTRTGKRSKSWIWKKKRKIGDGILIGRRKGKCSRTKTLYSTTKLLCELETRVITRLRKEETGTQPAIQIEVVVDFWLTYTKQELLI